MQLIFKILITILLFGVLIFIHELGHFLTARWAKVKIFEFSLGMGPAVVKKERKGIVYSLRAFPIGGFVQMDGEDGNGEDENSFDKKPKRKRFVILAAGAFNNIVFGLILICLVYGLMRGIKLYPTTYVAEFHENALSSQSGLAENDKIVAVNGYRIYSYSDLAYAFTLNNKKDLAITVIRDGKKVRLENVKMPVENDEYVGEHYEIDFTVYGTKKTVWSTIKYSFDNTISLSRSIYSFIGTLFTGKADLNNVSGPVGTTKIVGDSVVRKSGFDFASLFLIMAMISINLGIVNLLPFPALDGGRILLLGYEAIFKKRLNRKVEAAINTTGFILLMGLMVLITVKDIIHLF